MEFIDVAIRIMFPVIIYLLLLWQIIKIKQGLEKRIRDKERQTNQIWQEKIIDLSRDIKSTKIMVTNYESTYLFVNKYGTQLVAMLDEYNNKNKAKVKKRNKKNK